MSLTQRRIAMRVAEVMTRDPVTVAVGDTVRRAAAQMLDAAVRHLPVVDGQHVVGIISDRDIRNIFPLDRLHAGFADEARDALSRPVTTVMSRELLSVAPETPLADAVDLLLRGKVSALPVLDPDSKCLVGIITSTDVLRAARDRFDLPLPASTSL